MRDVLSDLNQDPSLINPIIPTDLVIDHSVQVDSFGREDSLTFNQDMEFKRNRERFQFLRWGQRNIDNFLIVPPGSGIVHQVNLEYLARVVFNNNGLLYPDSLVGTDSHTTMINGLGVLGWGVGGIEAEAAMLGETISMVLPKVVGVKLTGVMNQRCNATDLVLTLTEILRKRNVVGQFVEYFGDGCKTLTLSDRATIANMSPEYGATMGFFAVDEKTLEYLRQTGRDEEHIKVIEEYLKANALFRNYEKGDEDILYSGDLIELDLGSIVPSCAGPKRPQDRVALSDLKNEFNQALIAKPGLRGFGVKQEDVDAKVQFNYEGNDYVLGHGSVVIAAITSCTNTSNPDVMIAAGLLAKKAVEKGLSVKPFVKTSLSPGSGVVSKYYEIANLYPYLAKLGFALAGYGCQTCIGNSGDLPEAVEDAITKGDLVAASVLSGNRNFEGRVHSLCKANYLMSPPLVVAYAIAGSTKIDLETEPLGKDIDGNDVYLSEIWPTKEEIFKVIESVIIPQMFKDIYSQITKGTEQWNSLTITDDMKYNWDPESTYIKKPPFFQEAYNSEVRKIKDIENARCLLLLGDSVTTDHISPAGNISKTSAAAKYLIEKGVNVKEFNSYGARRGNFEVMARGTFANVRITNKLLNEVGPKSIHLPSGKVASIFEVAELYQQEGTPLIVIAGKEYGTGSSRDWAAKGPKLQGIHAVIAESFERIHRSNLVGMGILPLEFVDCNAESLKLKGDEEFTVHLNGEVKPNQIVKVSTNTGISFETKSRIDTLPEVQYYINNGILIYVLRKMIK